MNWMALLARLATRHAGNAWPKNVRNPNRSLCNADNRSYRAISTFGIDYGVSAVAKDADGCGNGSRGNDTGISFSASLR